MTAEAVPGRPADVAHLDRATAIEAAREAIRAELDEITILSGPAKRALAGRLSRVAVDAVLRVRESRR